AARGAIDGMLSFLAPDVIYLRPGAPAVYGADAARALLVTAASLVPSASSVSPAWQPLGGGVSNDLRSGYTYGVAARAAQNAAPIRLERYIAYWQRERSRPWRIVA